MKISFSPMTQLILRAERRINFFAVVSTQDLAHDRKRQLAQGVLEGVEPTAEFSKAAELEGLTAQALATKIIAKPDVMMQRENARRSLIIRARAAKTPEELKALLEANNINVHPEDKMLKLVDGESNG